jgi:hypothetical protein
MQEGQSTFKKSIGLLTLIVAAFSMVIISSCNDKSSNDPVCVKFTKAQIQKWIDKGYINRLDLNPMVSVRFTTAYAGPGTVFRVYITGVRKDGSIIKESLTELTPVDSCTKDHIKLSEFIFIGTNPADLSQLGILDKDGKIVDGLEYLQMTPFDYTDPKTKYDFLAYENSIKKGDGTTMMRPLIHSDQILPCPPCPNCPPSSCPKPPTCENCGASLDTAKAIHVIDTARVNQ